MASDQPISGEPTIPRRLLLSAALGGAIGLLARPAQATPLPRPSGPVVLTVSGRLVTRANSEAAADFDMAMLAALPQRTVVTRTPWYEGARRFSGPLLRDVLAAAGVTGAAGRSLRATALNDYRVEIPVDDATRFDVVVARALDDRPMAVREKGPLFVIYPFDDRPELANPTFFGRCIWQLRSIEVR